MKKILLISLILGSNLGGQNFAWSQYTTVEVTNGGVFQGQVTFAGEAPAPRELQVTQSLEACGKTTLYDESLIVSSESQGLKNAVVWLTDISSGKDWSAESELPTLDQNGCRFDPHVIVVPENVRFDVLNTDGTLHNIHTHGEKNRPINRAHPKFTKKIKLRFRVPEFVSVTCDVHGWMQAWIVVTAHPYYAVTDENGMFEIADIPTGTYDVEFWHEKLGTQTKEVTITESGVAKLDTQFAKQ